jgi:hypothetical protein
MPVVDDFFEPPFLLTSNRQSQTSVRQLSDHCPIISDWVSEIIGMRTTTIAEGIRRIEDVATGRVKGLTEEEFRAAYFTPLPGFPGSPAWQRPGRARDSRG